VLLGDNRFSEYLIQRAEGVDLLIHEVTAPDMFRRAFVAPELARTIMARHTAPEQAGEVFARTKSWLAVYAHIVRPIATEADLIPATRKNYAGPLEVGEDLMVIDIGDTITVQRPSAPAHK
jgi:ribonuclease Z